MSDVLFTAIGVCVGIVTDRVIMAWQWNRLRRVRTYRLGKENKRDRSA